MFILRALLVVLLAFYTNGARAELSSETMNGTDISGARGSPTITGGKFSGTISGAPTMSGAWTFSAGLTTTGGGALAASFTNFGRGNTYSLTGSSIDTTKVGLFNNNNCSGTSTAGEIPCLLYSTGSMSTNANNTIMDGANLVYQVGGAAAAAAQWNALAVTLLDSAATNDKAGGGSGAWVGLQVTRKASRNQGGSGLTPAASFGQSFGMDIVATLLSGATNMALNNGLEVDLSNQTGSSVVRSAVLQLSHSANHAVQSSMWDYAELITQTSASSPFLKLLTFGGGLSPHAPLDSTGDVIAYQVAQDVTAPANKGINFNDVTFTMCSLCLPGFVVSGSGAALGTTRIGSLFITPSSTGEALDASGSVATAMAINSGGSGYTDGQNMIVDDQYGGVEQVTSVSGVVTAIVSVIQQPVYPGLSPPATITTTARPPWTGTGLVLTPTWDSTRTTLKLNSSAGGETIIGSGANVSALNITKGFFHFPFTNATSGAGGIPTGTPGNISGNACIWNDVTFTLNCYSASAGAWKHATFSAGAG